MHPLTMGNLSKNEQIAPNLTLSFFESYNGLQQMYDSRFNDTRFVR